MTAPETWTAETVRAWLRDERHYPSDWYLEWARQDFAAALRHLKASMQGGGGPGTPSYETRGDYLSVWLPGSNWSNDPDFKFKVADLMRAAMALAPMESVKAAAAAGEYAGPPVQGGLL